MLRESCTPHEPAAGSDGKPELHGLTGRARHLLATNLVPAFIVGTYAWTWGVTVPAAAAVHGIGHAHPSLGALTLAGFAPTIVALTLLGLARGRGALRNVASRLVHARAPLGWYALSLFGPLAVIGASRLVLLLVGTPLPALDAWYRPFLGVLFLIPLTGFFEEAGWRGLLQDELQRRMSPARASLLVAVAWGPWHVPTYLRLMPEGDRTPLLIAAFLVATVPLSIIFAWLYNRTQRRLLPVIVLHAAIDAGFAYYFARIPTGELRPFLAWCAGLCVLAAVVLGYEGARLGCPVVPITSTRHDGAFSEAEASGDLTRPVATRRHP